MNHKPKWMCDECYAQVKTFITFKLCDTCQVAGKKALEGKKDGRDTHEQEPRKQD